jgi:hypothetical protein
MADLYTTSTGLSGDYATIGGNALKVLGDGASGVGPYTRFGTPQLQAVKVVASNYNFTTTPAASDSNLSKAIQGLQQLGEIYYAGIPTTSGGNQFVALINLNNTFNGATQGSSSTEGSADGSYTAVEADILAELGGAGTIAVSNVTLTGLSFA